MAPPIPGMKLTFTDEFDSLNLYSTWKPTDQWGNRNLPSNGEEQTYVDPKYKDLGLNPFSVSDGVLNIKAEKAGENADKLDGGEYTSGMLSSHGPGGFSQQYGYFEIRAQLPQGQGMWPAFWLLADNGEWPPELDVMESVGNSPNSAVQSIHSGDGNNGETTYTAEDLQEGFHTYGMNWTKDTITYYLDGKETAKFDTPSDMHDKMYMLVNLAVGGTWPGSPDDTTDWSKTDYKIDYVRAYSSDPDAKPVAASSLAAAQIASSDSSDTVLGNAIPGSESIDTASGEDAISMSEASSDTITGGTGRDVFSFMANAHATIVDFDSANDSIELNGINPSDVEVHANDNSTFIDLGNSGRITVAGAALSANDLRLSYA